MKAKTLYLFVLLTVSNAASAFTLGPLEITLTSGPNVNITFTNQFRGLLNSISDVIQNNTVVKFIKYALNYGSTSENLQIVPGKNNQVIPPPGWTDANTPPQTTSLTITYTYSGYSSPQAYCTANYGSTWLAVQRSTDWGCRNPSNPADIRQGSNNGVPTYTCPTGYTRSGDTCILSNASIVKWPSDGKPTFIQGADGQIKLHSRDPDLPSATGAGGSFAGGGASGSWRVPATDAYNNPVQVDHTATQDGGMDVSRKLETVNPDSGKPTVHEEITHFNDQGAITNNYHNEYPNTTINDINGGTAPPPSGNVNIEIPNITVSGNGGIIPAFNRGNTPTANQSLTDFKNYLQNQPIIKPLREATFTPSGQTCPMQLSVSMSPFGYPMNVSTDIMCQVAETMRPIIQAVTTFGWSWLALTVILGA